MVVFHWSLIISSSLQDLYQYSGGSQLCFNLVGLHSSFYFVSNTKLSTFDILLHFVYSCFDIILMALFWAAKRCNSVYLLSFPFLTYVYVFSCEI